jgi:tetratricopeptide (TPR) repeat protein
MKPGLRLAIGIVLAVVSGRALAQEPSTLELLDRYAMGKFADVNTTLAKTENFKRIYKDLRGDNTKAWLDAGGTGDRARRELAAATFALEAARADQWREWKWHQRQRALATPDGVPGGGASLSKVPVLYWLPPPVLIEWGCELMRAHAQTSEIERIWHLAAMAIGQRSEDYEFLIGFTTIDVVDAPPPPEPEPAPAQTPPPAPIPSIGGIPVRPRAADSGPVEVLNVQKEINHLNHTVERFPDEKRFVLGQALARERPSPSESIKVYYSLLDDPMVGGEAAARLGALYLRRGAVADALKMFDRAEKQTRDRDMLYLARFYRGQAHLRNRQENAAVASFRAALEARPASQSASVALAVILTKREQRAEAQAIMKAVLDAGPDHRDPHLEYVHGDDRFWPVLIARLQREIAR